MTIGREALPVDEERTRRARLAHIRQELLAPVGAIIGYQEILLEEVRRLGLEVLAPDLERVREAGGRLYELVDRLLETGPARPVADADLSELEAKLRHDLRTPLNAIMGYSELMLEELEAPSSDMLRLDLEKLLDEARRLLAAIDRIVDLSREGAAIGHDHAAASIAEELIRSIRPVAEPSGRLLELGRILVVDDNASNRELLCRQLSRDGHAATAVGSGREALVLLEAEIFDLILLDLMMPELNGYQVLAHLKGDRRWREIPVIMISGLRETDSVVRCIEAGADDYLPKPFDPVLLRARISACLERKRWHDRERQYLAELAAEKARADALLLNVLPRGIVSRLSAGEVLIADRVEDATILFCDLVGFTELAAVLPPARLIERLNGIFSEFDQLAHELGIEKIKTIGDAYMAAAGLPLPREDHATAMAELALGMLDALERQNATVRRPFRARIGMHTGPVVAGIIGRHKFIYDVWGDTVNLASRLEAHGLPNRIQVSAVTRDALADRYMFETRGLLEVRGKGQIPAYLLLGRHPGV